MGDVVPKLEKRLIPWPLRFILWLAIAVLCGIVGTAINHFAPPDRIIPHSLPSIVHEYLGMAAGPGLYGALIGMSVQWVLSKVYRGLRSV